MHSANTLSHRTIAGFCISYRGNNASITTYNRVRCRLAFQESFFRTARAFDGPVIVDGPNDGNYYFVLVNNVDDDGKARTEALTGGHDLHKKRESTYIQYTYNIIIYKMLSIYKPSNDNTTIPILFQHLKLAAPPP